MTILYILRQAQNIPTADLPQPEWPLTPSGQVQAQELAEKLNDTPIDAIVSSPYKRAMDTVKPLAQHKGLVIDIHQGLIDQAVSEEWLPPIEYQALVEKMWDDPHFLPYPEGETNSACQERISLVMQQIVDAYPGKTVLVCTHGQPMAQLLAKLDMSFGYRDWANMNMPKIVRINYSRQDKPQWEKEFVLA